MKKLGAVLLVLSIVAIAAYVALVYIPAHAPAPGAGTLYAAQILGTSSIDAAFTGVSNDGHTITWTLTQAEMGTLTLVELKVSIQNSNVGAGPYTMVASLTSCAKVYVAPSHEEMCAFNSNGNEDVTYALTTSGGPTGSQSGTTFTSNDWKAGASSVLDASMTIESQRLIKSDSEITQGTCRPAGSTPRLLSSCASVAQTATSSRQTMTSTCRAALRALPCASVNPIRVAP